MEEVKVGAGVVKAVEEGGEEAILRAQEAIIVIATAVPREAAVVRIEGVVAEAMLHHLLKILRRIFLL
jgi:hypothetical protein